MPGCQPKVCKDKLHYMIYSRKRLLPNRCVVERNHIDVGSVGHRSLLRRIVRSRVARTPESWSSWYVVRMMESCRMNTSAVSMDTDHPAEEAHMRML